jgi:formylglycine-generating enzyme required for sulfatase activity
MNNRHCHFGAALCAASLIAASGAVANNIQVSSVTLQNIDTSADTAMVRFDLGWENSWRVTNGPANHDAAWVFVKYHTGDLNWKTATLDVLDSAHSVPAGATLDMGVNGTRGMGAFIYRSVPGTGNVNYPNIRLKWNYGADLVSDAALVTLDVHAIEMVQIPAGSFMLGDGVVRAGTAEVATLADGNTPNPYTVLNGGPTNVGATPGNLGTTSLTAGNYRAIPTTFPNGFDAFYLMKYEASQGQWAAFLNTTSKLPAINYTYFEVLAANQLTGRQVFFSPDLPPPTQIPGPVPPNPAPPVPTRPLVQAKTPDRAFVSTEIATLAYLDWSGLRPFTELEYEKAARGPVPPVQGEFAWGTADIALLSYGTGAPGVTSLGNDGLPGEMPAVNYNEDGGNAWYRATLLTLPLSGSPSSPILGPARVGMFAKASYNPPTPPRIQSGAGYYGVMDLTGNVSEMVAKWSFQASTVTTNLFSAEHGDGLLGANGQHNVAGWALVPAGATFYGLRGGSFADAAMPISQRSLITAGTMTNPGIRGARTAPVASP